MVTIFCEIPSTEPSKCTQIQSYELCIITKIRKPRLFTFFFIVDGQTASKNRNRHNNVFIYIFFDNYSCTKKAQIFPLYELIF